MRSFQNSREDIPTTAYDAACYINKVMLYTEQVNGHRNNHDNWNILHQAHCKINDEYFEGEYVSNYIPR